MPILDRQVSPSAAPQAVTSAAVNSTDVIDLTVRRGLRNPTQHLIGQVQVGTAFTGGTSIQVDMVTADDSALTTNATVLNTSTTATANLTAGSVVFLRAVPPGRLRRYLGFKYTPTGTFTAGTFVGFFVLDVQDTANYPSGLNVSGI